MMPQAARKIHPGPVWRGRPRPRTMAAKNKFTRRHTNSHRCVPGPRARSAAGPQEGERMKLAARLFYSERRLIPYSVRASSKRYRSTLSLDLGGATDAVEHRHDP